MNRCKWEDVIKTADGHYALPEFTNGRDLRGYDKGSFHIGDNAYTQGISEERVAKDKIGIREFIWEHWKRRRRGHALITWHGVDTWYTVHLFIEPENDRWRIARRVVSFYPGGSGDHNEQVCVFAESATIYHVERKASVGDVSSIKPKQKRSAGSYVVVFRESANGEVKEEW